MYYQKYQKYKNRCRHLGGTNSDIPPLRVYALIDKALSIPVDNFADVTKVLPSDQTLLSLILTMKPTSKVYSLPILENQLYIYFQNREIAFLFSVYKNKKIDLNHIPSLI